MLSSLAQMGRPARRAVESSPVGDSWKIRISHAIREQGIARADLAKQVHCSAGYITMLLKLERDIGRAAVRNTTVKFAIERALGIEDKLTQFVRMWNDLDDGAQDTLLALLSLIARPRT